MSVLVFSVTGSQAEVSQLPRSQQADTSPAGNLLSDIRSWAEHLSPFTHDTGDDFHWVETTRASHDLREQATAYVDDQPETDHRERVVLPEGMFHRMGSGFHHGLSSSASRPIEATQDEHNLLLSVGLPKGIFLNPTDITWRIQPQGSPSAYRLYGQQQGLSLPVGTYQVSLNIGDYQEQRLVRVIPERVANAAFSGNFGRLQVYSEKLANWEAVSLQQGVPPSSIRSRAASRQFDAIVAAGEYDVIAMLGEVRQSVRVRVGAGKTGVAYVQIPGGRINLVATLGNAPALRPMEWKVFRLDEGRREIAAPARHSATLLVPAGHYEAIAILNGTQRSRQFTVTDGADSNVVLAMD
jgi:hypothetical protein